MKLRIHHFFDIIRDFGKKDDFKPHHYSHSYHLVANKIMVNPHLEIEIIRKCDDVCEGCIHNKDLHCNDSIHRSDFPGKEKFNDYIDSRIMLKCNIADDYILTPLEILHKAQNYIDHIEWIYEGNDPQATLERKINLQKGISAYFRQSSDFMKK
jgi:hypothetical protein